MASTVQDLHAQLTYKLKLENMMRLELRRVFNRIIKDYKTMIAAGFTPTGRSAFRYEGAIESILYGHYDRVQRKFEDLVGLDIRASIKQREDEGNDAEILALLLLEWRDQNAPQSARAISETTSNNMVTAYDRAMRDLQDDGEEVTDPGLAALAGLHLTRRLYGREEGITVLETQKAAESTKLIDGLVSAKTEASTIRNVLNTGTALVAASLFKTWRTVRDSKVRDAHRLADGQTVQATEPFIVKNQKLNYPGDGSLGASIDNIINCRCAALYSSSRTGV